MDGMKTQTIAPGMVLDTTPPPRTVPQAMTRGEFEAWAKIRGRGQYDVVRDQMRFRTSKGVYAVEMPVRFDVEVIDGIVYALASDIHANGKMQ